MDKIDWLFLLLIPLVSFLYASVGHGGASGYLALMALFSFEPKLMKSTALILNIAVAYIAWTHYYKVVGINKKMFAYLILFSIPAAYLGGKSVISVDLYRKILGFLLLIPAIKLTGILDSKTEIQNIKSYNIWGLMALGVGIGYISGLIGIGGGILLSPILLMLNWSDFKHTASISALFIVVNSISGFIGNNQPGFFLNPNMILLLILAMVGGILGAYFGSKKFNGLTLKRILASVLVLASLKLIFTV